MADPFARERAREVVHAGFGDGVGGVGLRGVDDVGGHGGCEEDGGGGEGEGDYLSGEGGLVGEGGGREGKADLATARATRKEPWRLTSKMRRQESRG